MYTIISTNSHGVNTVYYAETEYAAKLTFIDTVLTEIIDGMDNNNIVPDTPMLFDTFFEENKIHKDDKDFYDKNSTSISTKDRIITTKLAKYLVDNNLTKEFIDFIYKLDGWTMSDTVFTVRDWHNYENYIEVSLWQSTPIRIRTEKDFE